MIAETVSPPSAIQDYYAAGQCFGCGQHNQLGLHVRSFEERYDAATGAVTAVCRHTPEPYHHGYPGYVYGGLIACVVDCHAMATAIVAATRQAGRDVQRGTLVPCVTGSLTVRFVKAMPMGDMLVRAEAIPEGRKVRVRVSGGPTTDSALVCFEADVVAVTRAPRDADAGGARGANT